MQTVCSHFSEIVLPSTTKVVLLDLDNTLYLYEPCHTAAIWAIQAYLEKITGPITDFNNLYSSAQNSVKKRIPKHGASHSRILYFQAMLEVLIPKKTFRLSLELEAIYWKTFLTNMKLVSGAQEFLVNCRIRGTKIAVVSDLTTQIQCQKIINLGIESYIDFLVTAEEAGADKPSPKPFLLALEKASTTAGEALMIGDSLERDVAGAQALGIHAIHFTHT